MIRPELLKLQREFMEMIACPDDSKRQLLARDWWNNHVIAIGTSFRVSKVEAERVRHENEYWEWAKKKQYSDLGKLMADKDFAVIETEIDPITKDTLKHLEMWVLK